jgi:hypothetical protein
MNRSINQEVLKDMFDFVEENKVYNEDEYQAIRSLLIQIDEAIESEYSSDLTEKQAQDDVFLHLSKEYGKLVGDFKYKLKLSKGEYLSLKRFIYERFIYDREMILVGVAVKSFISKYDNQKSTRTTDIKFKENEEFSFDMDISDFARLINITSLYKFAGLDGEAECFANIMSKVIIISKVSEVFKTIGNGNKQDYDNKMSCYDLGLNTDGSLKEPVQ